VVFCSACCLQQVPLEILHILLCASQILVLNDDVGTKQTNY
jgi:hypothetical protein